MGSKQDCVRIVMTGGTIDSVWDDRLDSVVVSEHSTIPGYFQKIKLPAEFEYSEVCMKDSRALNTQDLENILKLVEEALEKKIIITHGVYTMPDTARFLKNHLKRQDQIVILTGALTPLKGLGASDAAFNLGFAYAKLQDLTPGIYLCLNGEVFSLEELTKSLAEGKFYSAFQEKQ